MGRHASPGPSACPGRRSRCRNLALAAICGAAVAIGADVACGATPAPGERVEPGALRALLSGGRAVDAEQQAWASLPRLDMALRADTLRYAELLAVIVEARLRRGQDSGDSTRLLAERLVAVRERALGVAHPDLASALDYLGMALQGTGDRRGARTAFERALAIRERALGRDHPQFVKSQINLATAFFSTGEHDSARGLLERALPVAEARLPPDHPDIATVSHNLAQARVAVGDTNAVGALFLRAEVIWERRADHRSLATALRNHGVWEGAQGRYPTAASLLDRARGIDERLDPSGPGLAATLRERARLHLLEGDAAAAERLIHAAGQLFASAADAKSRESAECSELLAEVRHMQGRFAEARDLHAAALAAFEKLADGDSSDVAGCLQSYASLLADADEPDRARELLERALGIRIRWPGPGRLHLAAALIGSANAMRAMAMADSARARAERAREILERFAGPGHPLLADAMLALAMLALETGDLARARALATQALEIHERALAPGHRKVAECLHLLGVIERSLGNPAAARDTLERARAILERAPGDPARLAAVLNSLGVLERQLGRPREASDRFEQALDAWAKSAATEHSGASLALRNLGSLANARSDYAAAESRFTRVLEMLGKRREERRAEMASALIGLANARRGSGDLATARALYRRALALHLGSLPPGSPALAIDYHNLAAALLETGEIEAALDTALLAESITRDHFRLVARGLSETEALRYAATRARGLDIALTATIRIPRAAARWRAWDAVVRSRALILDEMAERRRALATASDPALVTLHERLGAASGRLAQLTVKGRGSLAPQRYREALDQARGEQEAAERAIAARSERFRLAQSRRQVSLADVSAALPQDGALVAYVRYQRMERERGSATPGSTAPAGKRGQGVPSYLAFVLRRSGPEVDCVGLGPADALEERIARWQIEAAEGAGRERPAAAESTYRRVAAELRSTLWDSVAVRIAGAKQVFVVADGAIHLLNLYALPAAGTEYLVESGPSIHLLSAERDLVPAPGTPPRGRGLLTVAGIDFDAATRGSARRAGAGSSGSGRRGAMCVEFKSLYFDSLPGTRFEERNVVRLWRRYHSRLPGEDGVASRADPGAFRELLGAEATEQAFKRLAPGHGLLHVATHGFFLGGDCGSGLEGRDVPPSEEDADAAAEAGSPLLLSGLALAGANHGRRSDASDEDGVLTAEEIAALNLAGLDWAVLSACQTGLGKVEAGEGVFGLRRAFQIAGARTVIMTLWAVDDQAAAIWMEALYDHRLRRREPTIEAVREASLEVLRQRRSKRLSTHPFYWGAFVAAGDWD